LYGGFIHVLMLKVLGLGSPGYPFNLHNYRNALLTMMYVS